MKMTDEARGSIVTRRKRECDSWEPAGCHCLGWKVQTGKKDGLRTPCPGWGMETGTYTVTM